jgi:hypothetical protein
MLRSHVRTSQDDLIIDIRPKCGKCKKEFMLSLKNYTPGKFHSCTACGNVIQFNVAIAEKIQKLTKEFADTIRQAIEDVQKLQ